MSPVRKPAAPKWKRVQMCESDPEEGYYFELFATPLRLMADDGYWAIGMTEGTIQYSDPEWEGKCRGGHAGAKAKALAMARGILEGALAKLGDGPVATPKAPGPWGGWWCGESGEAERKADLAKRVAERDARESEAQP